MNRNGFGNVAHQIRIVNRSPGIRRFQNVDFVAETGQVLRETERALNSDAAYRRKQVRDDEYASIERNAF